MAGCCIDSRVTCNRLANADSEFFTAPPPVTMISTLNNYLYIPSLICLNSFRCNFEAWFCTESSSIHNHRLFMRFEAILDVIPDFVKSWACCRCLISLCCLVSCFSRRDCCFCVCISAASCVWPKHHYLNQCWKKYYNSLPWAMAWGESIFPLLFLSCLAFSSALSSILLNSIFASWIECHWSSISFCIQHWLHILYLAHWCRKRVGQGSEV